jgi:hypothetical protein
MKFFMKVFFLVFVSFAVRASPVMSESLFLIKGSQRIDAQSLVDLNQLAYSIDRKSRFCYTGDIDQVVDLIKRWNRQGHFFSGGGGGHVIERLTVTRRGVVGPKINLVIRSEVTDEIENTIYILKCPLY